MKKDRIHFEINGGPVKKQKWYQHIQVGGAGGMSTLGPSDSNANPRGSYVDLVFDNGYVPELNPQELKDLLRPVFDFNAKSAMEAYLDTLPPKLRDAIKAHHVLVGMNREMVLAAMGRPPKKIREKDGEVEYEEWIYGEPPADVDFVRLVGDEVIRLESMKVDGEKVVHTEKEVDLGVHRRQEFSTRGASTQCAYAPPPRRRNRHRFTGRWRRAHDRPSARPAGPGQPVHPTQLRRSMQARASALAWGPEPAVASALSADRAQPTRALFALKSRPWFDVATAVHGRAGAGGRSPGR